MAVPSRRECLHALVLQHCVLHSFIIRSFILLNLPFPPPPKMPSSTSPADPKAFTIILLLVYISLFLPSLFTLYKHFGSNFLGWLSISIFFLLRIIGSGLTIHDDNANATPKAAILLNSIGLSLLLLGTMGLLHEAYVMFPTLSYSAPIHKTK
jgi:hypothetical protein